MPEPLPRGPKTNTPRGQLQKISEQGPISFIRGISKGRPQQALDPAEVNSALFGHHLQSSSYIVVSVDPPISQLEDEHHA